MSSDPRAEMARRLREQAKWCAKLGSPLYALLLGRAAEDLEAGGVVATVLAGHEEDPAGSALALRLAGAVHRRVLDGEERELARFYPSAGGTEPADGAWPAFRRVLENETESIRRGIERPVQTNEVGRSAALAGGFAVVARDSRLPLRLLEIGASAGLNLRFDRYAYECGGRTFGDPASAVRFTGRWPGGCPPFDARLEVIERHGCDPEPVDATTPEGRRTLLSYVWQDQHARLAILRAAIDVASRVPATIDQERAEPWLRGELAAPARGAATVVFHSIVMPYLSRDARAAVAALLASAGARASDDAPLAWLRLERGGEEAELRLTCWPDDRERLLAEASFHGTWVRWLES